MKQVLQNIRNGTVTLTETPAPSIASGSVGIRTVRTVISSGTERMLIEFGKANWFDKARQQPEKVRQVLQKVKADGLGPTVESVRNKLD